MKSSLLMLHLLLFGEAVAQFNKETYPVDPA
jgi:hypothetical protein